MDIINELFSLRGKTALVTGAGHGLGRGYALCLARAGAAVGCFGRNADALEETVHKIRAEGFKASAIVGDITRQTDIDFAVNQMEAFFGGIDILVNNAGTESPAPFVEVREEDFDSIMSVNIKGVYRMCQTAVKSMRVRGAGKIINIGSLGSYIGLAGSTVYCCSKGAVIQLTKSLAIELAPYSINVNAIAPGYFRTAMTEPFFQDPAHAEWILNRIPLGRVGTEKDLMGTAIFLAGPASDYITGQTVIVDGGWLAS